MIRLIILIIGVLRAVYFESFIILYLAAFLFIPKKKKYESPVIAKQIVDINKLVSEVDKIQDNLFTKVFNKY